MGAARQKKIESLNTRRSVADGFALQLPSGLCPRVQRIRKAWWGGLHWRLRHHGGDVPGGGAPGAGGRGQPELSWGGSRLTLRYLFPSSFPPFYSPRCPVDWKMSETDPCLVALFCVAPTLQVQVSPWFVVLCCFSRNVSVGRPQEGLRLIWARNSPKVCFKLTREGIQTCVSFPYAVRHY